MISIDASECLRNLATIERRVLDVGRVGIADVVKVAYRSAKETTLYRDQTGELRGTTDIVDTGAYSKRLIWRAKHARFLTEGTKAHGPVNAKMMRFVIGGRVVYAKWVRGISKRPFDTNAAAAGAQAMHVIMNEGAERAVNYP